MGNKCVKCEFPNFDTQEEIKTEPKNKKSVSDSTKNDFAMNLNQISTEKDIMNKKIQILNSELDNLKTNIHNDNQDNEDNINKKENNNNNDFLKLDNPITFDNKDDDNFNLFNSKNVNESVKEENNNNNKNNDIAIYSDKGSNNNNENLIDLNKENNLPNDDFSKYIFEHINQIRKNPKDFIDIIEKSKSCIIKDKHDRLIYKNKKVKVALNQGLPIFDEAISVLEQTEPMNELIFNPNICIPLPDNENDIKSKEYLKEKKEEINQNIPIANYWRDIINDAETSFILMIVDDTGNKSGKKRNDILNPDYKYIGISSVTIGKAFACYVTFSK